MSIGDRMEFRQCDQNGRSWNVFGDNVFFQKCIQTYGDFLGYFENVTFYVLVVMDFLGNFCIKLGSFFISTSGHTEFRKKFRSVQLVGECIELVKFRLIHFINLVIEWDKELLGKWKKMNNGIGPKVKQSTNVSLPVLFTHVFLGTKKVPSSSMTMLWS